MKNKLKTKKQTKAQLSRKARIRPPHKSKNPSIHQSIAVKRPPLERMKKIYGWLQDQTYPNCARISAEYRISRLTALRDIDSMRDRMELPIEYDDKRHGYYFSEPVAGFPGVAVTERELFWVCIAHKALDQYHGTPFQQPLELAFQKLSGQLDDSERFTMHNLDEVLSFRPFAPEDPDLKLFELVTHALTERQAMTFQYRKPGEKSAHVRHVHPYHLMEFGDRWYLVGHDLKRDAIRKFVLGRMRDAAVTDEHFVKPRDFDTKKLFAKSLGVMTGKGDYEVVIEMDAWLTDILRGRRWHPSQVVEELPSGASHLRMHLSCLEEIEQYVLSWGTHATAIAPAELATRIAATARALVERYANAPAVTAAPNDTEPSLSLGERAG